MNTLTHAAAQDWILSGRSLKPEEAADLSGHLAGCAECRRFAAFHQELLAAVPGVAPSITHTEGELRQRIASVKTRLKPRSASARVFHVTRAVAFPLSAVAVIILLAFLIARLIPEQTRLTPGGAATPSPVQTSAPSPTAGPTQAPTFTPVVSPFQSVLDVFPLVPGAQWTYTDTEYAPAPNDAAQTVQGVFEITDRVVEAQAVGPAYFAHIQRRVTQLNADPAWAAQAQNPPADAEWWYIVNAGQVYSSPVMPSDPQNFPYNSLTLEFQFPLKVDAKWCPNRGAKGFVDPSIPTPQPCAADIGARIVRSATPYQSAAGTFPTCYLLDDVYNTGDTLQTFCDGAGVVARKFDHPGTRFGYAWELKSFISGAASTAAASPTPPPTSQSTDEQALAKALLSQDQNVYCSWQILTPPTATDLYAWALCELQVSPNSAVSAPVAVHLDASGHYAQVQIPRDGSLYAPDIRQLFPTEAQTIIFDRTFDLVRLEWGIAQRKAGELRGPYILPYIPSEYPGCTWQNRPLADLPASANPALSGWKTVTRSEYGFSLSIPSDWSAAISGWDCGKASIEAHSLYLQSPDGRYQLTVGFRQPDQPYWITRTGTPAGDFVEAGTVSFFGKALPAQRLVYQSRDMAVFYNGSSEFAAGGILFTLSLDITSDPQNKLSIPADVEDLSRKILESFQVYSPPSSPTPTPPASAPAITPLALLAQRGGSVQGVAVSGSTAYIGSGSRLSALDVSDPSAPRLLAQSEPLPGLVSGVVLFSTTPKMQAAAVSAGRYVEVLDISRADKIVRVNEVALPGTINAMVLDTTNWKLYVGGFVYKNVDSNTSVNTGYVAVVDLANGVRLGQVRDLVDPVGSLARTDGMLYAGNVNAGVTAITGVPLLFSGQFGEPRPAVTVNGLALDIYSLQAAGNRLYAGSYSAMLAYDISNPAAPIEKWRATQDDAGNALMMVQGFVLHANRIDMAGLVPSGGMGGPWQASLTPPEAVPVDSGSAAATIAAGDSSRLYVTRDGLRIFDAGSPQSLKPLGVYQPPLLYTIDQAAAGDLLYTLDTDSSSHNWAQFLHVLRLPGLETVGEYRFAGPDDAPGWEYYSGMAVEGNRLYVFDLHKGTWAFDLSDPLKPALLNRPGVFSDGLSAAAAAASDGRHLLFKSSPQSASPNTLDVYDVTDLDNIVSLSSLELKNEDVTRMRWSGNALYAVTQANPAAGNDFTYWFYIIGLENGALKIQYRMQLEADANLAAQGSLVALAEPQKLILLSATDPALVQVIKYQTSLPAPAGLDFLGDRLLVSMPGSTSQLLIFDLSNPSHPALAYALDVPYTERLSTSAPFAVLSAGSSGITVLK